VALSDLEPDLARLGVNMYAVVGETLGAEEFGNFFKGKAIYLDPERAFFGPKIRKMGLLGFLRLDVWMSILESKKKGNAGNFEGDGYHLGAVFVVGPGDQGILYEHREKSWGDNVNASQVLSTVESMVGKTE